MERHHLDIKIGGTIHVGRKTISQTHSGVEASTEPAAIDTKTTLESDSIDR